MINLAGKEDCDVYIRHELRHARIPIVDAPLLKGEVPSRIRGQLKDFVFEREWYYYVVVGVMPLEVALALYEDPLGRDDVRVGGHCGCPSPLEYGTTFLDADGLMLYQDVDGAQREKYDHLVAEGLVEERKDFRFVPDVKAAAVVGYITCYHVDSEAGLRLLADTITLMPELPPLLAVRRVAP
jgi:hypothetical protein